MKKMTAVLLFISCASAVWAQQEQRAKAKDLLQTAREELAAGNKDQAYRCMAEAWALTSEAYWLEKNRTAAREAWSKAEKQGWKGTPPWIKWPEESAVKPTPPPTRRQPQEEYTYEDEPAQERRALGDGWSELAWTPLRTGRNNAFHSLVNIPALEDAHLYPVGKWYGRFGLELMSADFASTSGGGTTRWDATLVQETFEANYTFSNSFQGGARLTTGELTENSSLPLTVFEGGQQIVPNGSRSLGPESLVFRGKYVGQYDFADWGILGELKFPIASSDDFLTSSTSDLGVSYILSKPLGESWQGVGNFGFVLPLGDADLFTTSSANDLDLVIHGGAGLSNRLSDRFTLAFQIEGNTSPFGNVTVLDETVLGAYVSGRYLTSETMFLELYLGNGFGDLGSDLTFGVTTSIMF